MRTPSLVRDNIMCNEDRHLENLISHEEKETTKTIPLRCLQIYLHQKNVCP